MVPAPSPVPGPRHALLLFVSSASVLAHQILLMRVLSYALWHHFAAMVISMALLGFGAAGSFLFLAQERLKRDPDGALAALSACAALAFPGSLLLFRASGLDPLQLVWRPGEWLNMAAAYLSLSLPFLLAGGIAGALLSMAGERTPRMYAADLGGAGVGVLAVIPALYLAPPWFLLSPAGAVLLLAAVPCARASSRPVRAFTLLALSGILLLAGAGGLSLAPKIHESKGLAQALTFPDASVEAERVGPLGLVHVVGSSHFHHVPGLSLQYGAATEAPLPGQRGLFLDGSGPGSITRFTGEHEETLHLDYTTRALPFHVRRPERVLVTGAGGGSDVLLAVHHRVPRIDALEANPQVAALMAGPMSDFTGHLFQRPGVRLMVTEARRYLQTPGPAYDLIQLSPTDSFGAASGGLHAAAEEYLATVEAFEACLERLCGDGMLAVTCYIQVPPRDSLRVFATAMEALRRSGAGRPERGLLFIRSWNTATVVASNTPFSPEERAAVEAFCTKRSFDTVFYPAMPPERANRFDIQPRPWYHEGAAALAGPAPEAFLESYVYDVAPRTDDRPYVSRFFRWDRARELFGHLRREWLPRVESGYVFLLATLVQAGAAGAVLILLPLLFLPRKGENRDEARGPGRFRTLLYFVFPGLGFMFFEMALIPRFTLLLAHPVYAAAVVLGTVLLFAGLGSLTLPRLGNRGAGIVWAGFAGLALWLGAMILAGDRWIESALSWSGPSRFAAAVGCLAVPSFFMGWPFPLGLREVSRRRPRLAPWAWGVNGCASVMGAVLGKVLAMDLGFRGVLAAGLGLYLLAAWSFPGPGREGTSRTSSLSRAALVWFRHFGMRGEKT
jgi:spermidine synthase